MNYKIVQLIPYVGDEELTNLKKVIKNKWLTEGPFSNELIDIVKDFTKAKYALLTNNGTLALYLSLKAIGISKGDEVITPDFTFNATASCVVFAGAKPVFVDVSNKTGNIDISLIEKHITENTRAIMPVHIYGQSADMDPIIELAKKYQLKVIEDAAQGYGVFYKGKHTGTIGDLGIISFYADKTVTTGEGAIILTNNYELYEKLRYLRNQGRISSGSFVHPQIGMNFRITDLQSAIGVAQIKKFRKIEKIKLNNYNIYKKLLEGVMEVKFLEEVDYSNIVPFRANILVSSAKKLMNHLENNGIQTRGFFYPLHRQPCFDYLLYNNDSFPISNELNASGVCLPIHCELSENDIVYICDTIKSFYT